MKISHNQGNNVLDFSDLKSKMQNAISKLQTSDPKLAKKLTSIENEVTTLTKGGASTQDALKQAVKDNGSLTSGETSELKSALGLGTTSGSGSTDSLDSLLSQLQNQSSGTSASLSGGTNSLIGQMLASRYGSAAPPNAQMASSLLGSDGISA